jgi:hypothetical protein
MKLGEAAWCLLLGNCIATLGLLYLFPYHFEVGHLLTCSGVANAVILALWFGAGMHDFCQALVHKIRGHK